MKKVLNKKLVCGMLAATMCVGTALPALAADPAPDAYGNTYNSADQSVNIAATTQAQSDIKVSIVPSGGVIFNPYGLEVLVRDSLGNRTPSTATVISAPYAIKNFTNTDLDISATIKTTLPSESGTYSPYELVGEPGDSENAIAKNTDGRQAFLYAQFIDRMKQGERNTVLPRTATAPAVAAPYSDEDQPAAWSDPAHLVNSGYDGTSTSAVKFYNHTESYNLDESESDNANAYSKTCALADTTGDDGKTFAQVAKLEHNGASKTGVSTVWYKILGLTSNPAAADNQWTSSDTLTTKLTFRFAKSVKDKETAADPYGATLLSTATPYYSNTLDLVLPFTMPTGQLVGNGASDIKLQRLVIEGMPSIDLTDTTINPTANPTAKLNKYGTMLTLSKTLFQIGSGASAVTREGGDSLRFTVAYDYVDNTTQKTIKTGTSYYVVMPARNNTAFGLTDYATVDSATGNVSDTFGVRIKSDATTVLSGTAGDYSTAPTVADATTYAAADIDLSTNLLTLKDGSTHHYLKNNLKVAGDTMTYYVPVTYQLNSNGNPQYVLYAVTVNALAKAEITATDTTLSDAAVAAADEDLGAPLATGTALSNVSITDLQAYGDLTGALAAADLDIDATTDDTKAQLVAKKNGKLDTDLEDGQYVIIRGEITYTDTPANGSPTTSTKTFQIKVTGAA